MNLQITVNPWVGALSQRKFAAPSRPAAQSFCATSIARHYQTMTATPITEKLASNAAHTVSVAVVSASALGSMTDGVLPAICRGTDRPTDGAAGKLSGVEPPGLEAVGVGLMMGRHQLVTAVIGRSGCGKKSLVRIVCMSAEGKQQWHVRFTDATAADGSGESCWSRTNCGQPPSARAHRSRRRISGSIRIGRGGYR
jgi:hypothetical protein